MPDVLKRTIYISPELVMKLEKSADDLGMTCNTVIKLLLEDYYNNERKVFVDYMRGNRK